MFFPRSCDPAHYFAESSANGKGADPEMPPAEGPSGVLPDREASLNKSAGSNPDVSGFELSWLTQVRIIPLSQRPKIDILFKAPPRLKIAIRARMENRRKGGRVV